MKKAALFSFGFLLFVLSVNLEAQTPRSIRIESGDTHIELAAHFFWNLSGIWYKGENVGLKGRGYYGTVADFDSLGWVGTGHLENKIGETELKVEFWVDGQPWQATETPVKCTRFEMRKRSLLHKLRLEYTLKLENNSLREFAAVTVEDDCRIRVLYHFMHPWMPKFTEYLVASRTKEMISGTFSTTNQETIPGNNPDWVAFYASPEQFGIISIVRDCSLPSASGDGWLIWNRLLEDRKLYYIPSKRADLRKDRRFESEMITAFFTASPENWQKLTQEQAVILKGLWK